MGSRVIDASVQIGDWVVGIGEEEEGCGVCQITRLDPKCSYGLPYHLSGWGWVPAVRPATPEEIALAQLASLEGL